MTQPMITLHEYGAENRRVVVLVHPSVVFWDYYEYVIPLLSDYHVIVPALPGYDKETPEENYSSVEEIAAALANQLITRGIPAVDLLYGCSMGGSIVLRMLVDGRLPIRNAICDAGITPYRLPYLVTRLIAVKDFLLIAMGKMGGISLLEKAFATDEYSHEDLEYMADVFHFISYRTIWRTFESCNNYAMPEPAPAYNGCLQYWYGDKEARERAGDIRYVQRYFPGAELICMEDLGHVGMALLRPLEMAGRIREIIESS